MILQFVAAKVKPLFQHVSASRCPRCRENFAHEEAPKLSSKDAADMGDALPTQPTVGTNLTDLTIQKAHVTVREVGGSMGPIWPSYYRDCKSVIFMVDAANPNQVSASCIQLLAVLSAEPLVSASVLILFNKIDLPCYMSLVEIKSLFRMDDIISCAKQQISVLQTSSLDGTGLQDVMHWLHSNCAQ
ncbi:ADP-ribosylation factor-like protein 16 [Xenopus tropicalis]|uniref:ADP-ribosylation factor-like protein 16 n=1 Tax=Xenopus tropicalis TaxID=8364 RepID=Q28DQ6_XENTR|nr:ADP-ribosylation factor-like protein 16 [Xenopus tropicalis]CAJ82006.1 novel ADP-ribosylation factor family protein [Xenopus tropicalis]|eukprot:NP_001039060.1 ADP-ribosylation factor-like protein 16 [Xenopus tropicalis]